jgi:hypothetical protein
MESEPYFVVSTLAAPWNNSFQLTTKRLTFQASTGANTLMEMNAFATAPLSATIKQIGEKPTIHLNDGRCCLLSMH